MIDVQILAKKFIEKAVQACRGTESYGKERVLGVSAKSNHTTTRIDAVAKRTKLSRARLELAALGFLLFEQS